MYVSRVPQYSKSSDGNVGIVDDFKPSDRVSNVGSRGSRRICSSRSRSSISSTSSSRINAEADMAALKAQQKMLRQKHALDKQEEEN